MEHHGHAGWWVPSQDGENAGHRAGLLDPRHSDAHTMDSSGGHIVVETRGHRAAGFLGPLLHFDPVGLSLVNT